MKSWQRIPRLLAAGLLMASAAPALILMSLPAVLADNQLVTAVPIPTFMSAKVGQPVQGLIWRGGIAMESAADNFGGLSGIGYTGPENRLVMVSDRGNFVSGQLIYTQDGQPASLVGVTIDPIQNSKGAVLPRAYARDAEALTVIPRNGAPAAVRIGFENLTRVADFNLVDGVPKGAAREVSIPKWLSDTRTNETLEAVCLAPPASSIAGSTLLLTEGVIADDGLHSAYLLGHDDRGPLGYASGPGTDPSDCAFLPDGDLLVLERGVALLTFKMRLVRVPAAEVKPGAQLHGDVLLEATGPDIDNMEGIAVHPGPGGETRITLISDDNFNDWERSLLLEFGLPD